MGAIVDFSHAGRSELCTPKGKYAGSQVTNQTDSHLIVQKYLSIITNEEVDGHYDFLSDSRLAGIPRIFAAEPPATRPLPKA